MTRLIVIVGFAFAFGAGLLIGFNRQPVAGQQGSPSDGPRDRSSWLAQQLQLTPEQQEKLKAIWSEAAGKGRSHQYEQRRQLREQRDAAVEKLIRDEDRAAYEKIQREYDEQVKANEAEWRQSFQRSVERTKEILTPEQREKYESILSRQFGDRSRGSTGSPAGSQQSGSASRPVWPPQQQPQSPTTFPSRPMANPTH